MKNKHDNINTTCTCNGVCFFILYGIYCIQNYYSIDMAILSAMNPSLHIREDDIPPCCCVAGRLVHGLANVRPCMQLGRVKRFQDG